MPARGSPAGDGTVIRTRPLRFSVSDGFDPSGGDTSKADAGGTQGVNASDDDGAPGNDLHAGDDHPGDGEGEGVFGEVVPAVPVEPGTPSIENAAFVLLGAASTIALFVHLLSLVKL